MNPERILDVIGTLEGTNKSSLYHDYLYAYENVLRPLRQEHFTLLEIGVYDGASLRMWKNYFPHAKIVGIDINPACADLAAERIAVEIGSQDDPEFLDRVMQQYRPLVVIDDGSHLAHHIISSFWSTSAARCWRKAAYTSSRTRRSISAIRRPGT